VDYGHQDLKNFMTERGHRYYLIMSDEFRNSKF